MSGFEERERAFEKKFEMDEELGFKIASRAAHLFGVWAAGQMGVTGSAADAYANQLVEMEMKKSGYDQVMLKVEKDLADKGMVLSRHRLEHEMNSFYAVAHEQIKGSAKN